MVAQPAEVVQRPCGGATSRRNETWHIRWEDPPPFATLKAEWIKQAAETRAAIDGVRDWLEPIEYRVTDDDGRKIIVTASAADIVTQLALHEVHHRAQATHILTRLGAGVGDIDYNLLMYQRRELQSAYVSEFRSEDAPSTCRPLLPKSPVLSFNHSLELLPTSEHLLVETLIQ